MCVCTKHLSVSANARLLCADNNHRKHNAQCPHASIIRRIYSQMLMCQQQGFPFLINSSCAVLLSHPNKEQQQVSNNGRPAKWVGGVYTRCATLLTNMGHDNPSLKIPLPVRHPAEAGSWPETINLYMIINPHSNSLLFIGPLYCPADGWTSPELTFAKANVGFMARLDSR